MLYEVITSREQGHDVLEALLLAQRADFSTFLIPDLLDGTAPGFRAAVLAGPDAEDPALLIGEVAASEKRLSVAANLASSGLAVWGDDGWSAVGGRGLDYRGPAGHRVELTKIYVITSYSIHYTKLYEAVRRSSKA